MRPTGPRPDQTAGDEALRRLAQGAIAALRDAGLDAEMGELQRRVFARAADDLFENDLTQHPPAVRFKPMVELLLLHFRDIATSHAHSIDERRREIRWALDASGY